MRNDFILCLSFIPVVWICKTMFDIPSFIIFASLFLCALVYAVAQYVVLKNEFIYQAITTIKNKFKK
jgi:hypothetical protein